MTQSDTSLYDDPVEYETEIVPEDHEPLPPRPRRRLLTPVTAGLGAVIVGAAGFFGGVQVQKNDEEGGAAAGPGGGLAGALAARGGGAPGASGRGQGSGTAAGGQNATIGTVANTKGMTIYVTATDGSTIRVRTKKATEVTRTATSVPRSVRPGDTVVVTGTTNDDGTVTAASIRATQDGVTGGGMGMGMGGPPSAGFPGGGAPAGAPGAAAAP